MIQSPSKQCHTSTMTFKSVTLICFMVCLFVHFSSEDVRNDIQQHVILPFGLTPASVGAGTQSCTTYKPETIQLIQAAYINMTVPICALRWNTCIRPCIKYYALINPVFLFKEAFQSFSNILIIWAKNAQNTQNGQTLKNVETQSCVFQHLTLSGRGVHLSCSTPTAVHCLHWE